LPEQSLPGLKPQNERIILVIFGGLLAGWPRLWPSRIVGPPAMKTSLVPIYATKHLNAKLESIAVIASVGSTAFRVEMLTSQEW